MSTRFTFCAACTLGLSLPLWFAACGSKVQGEGSGGGAGSDNIGGAKSTGEGGGQSSSSGGQAAMGCAAASDCNDGDPCNGVERCTGGECAAGQPLCDNPEPDHCECVVVAGTCALQAKDADKDGYGDALCTAAGGNDCNDQNATVHPTAEELCDGLDNDCNGLGDIEEGFALSGSDPSIPYSSSYLSTGYQQKLYGNWVPTMSSLYLVSGLLLQRINSNGTVNGSTVTLVPEHEVAGGVSGSGILAAAVGDTVGLIYTYGAGPADVGFDVLGRGGDSLSSIWLAGFALHLDSDVTTFDDGFVTGSLLDLSPTRLRLRPHSSTGSPGSQVDEDIPEAAGIQLAGGDGVLGALVTPDAAAGSLLLRVFDSDLELQRKINVGKGEGVIGSRRDHLGVAYRESDTTRFVVWDAEGTVVCSRELGTTPAWQVEGSGDQWHVVLAEQYGYPKLEILTENCQHVDSAQLLESFTVKTTDGEGLYAAGDAASAIAIRRDYTPTSATVQARFFGRPLCLEP